MNRLLPLIAFFATSAFAAERVIINPDQDGDLKIKVNDGGTVTDVFSVTGSTSYVTLGPTAAGSESGQMLFQRSSNYLSAGGLGGAYIKGDGRAILSFGATSGNPNVIQFRNQSGTQTGLSLLNSSGASVLSFTDLGATTIGDTGGNGGNVPHACARVVGTTQVGSSTCSVNCGSGEILTGGGCTNSLTTQNLQDSSPATATQWACVYGAVGGNCTAYAICCDY